MANDDYGYYGYDWYSPTTYSNANSYGDSGYYGYNWYNPTAYSGGGSDLYTGTTDQNGQTGQSTWDKILGSATTGLTSAIPAVLGTGISALINATYGSKGASTDKSETSTRSYLSGTSDIAKQLQSMYETQYANALNQNVLSPQESMTLQALQNQYLTGTSPEDIASQYFYKQSQLGSEDYYSPETWARGEEELRSGLEAGRYGTARELEGLYGLNLGRSGIPTGLYAQAALANEADIRQQLADYIAREAAAEATAKGLASTRGQDLMTQYLSASPMGTEKMSQILGLMGGQRTAEEEARQRTLTEQQASMQGLYQLLAAMLGSPISSTTTGTTDVTGQGNTWQNFLSQLSPSIAAGGSNLTENLLKLLQGNA